MKKKIIIEKKMFLVPVKIEIDGKNYPIYKWNIDVVRKYEKTKDEKVLDDLKDFSLVFE